MIDAPAVVLIGAATQATGPMHRLGPPAAASSAHERRVAAADAELARDPGIVGIAAIAEIYRRA